MRIFDSSTGFLLPDGSVLSPEQRRAFPPLCPDRVVELASTNDANPSEEGPRGLTALRHKMDRFQAKGARLGWLLRPQERAVELWRGGQQGMAERLENASRLDGSELVEGLAPDLKEIWAM